MDMNDLILVSVDDHVVEPPDMWERHVSKADLEKLGEAAGPALEQAWAKAKDLDVRRRLERLLDRQPWPGKDPDLLREARAVEVLEHIATEEAIEVLRRFDKDAPDTTLGVAAKAAVRRLARRQ